MSGQGFIFAALSLFFFFFHHFVCIFNLVIYEDRAFIMCVFF